MPIDRIFDRFKSHKPESTFVPGAIELKNFEKFTAEDISRLLDQRHVFDDFPEIGRELVVERTVTLIMGFIHGANQEYNLYEQKKLRFKRASLKVFLYDNEAVPKATYNFKENALGLSLTDLTTFVYQLSRNNVAISFRDKFNEVKLWGTEEANHSIYEQYKKNLSDALPPTAETEKYISQDHEFRGLIAKERLAKRDAMPKKTVTELQDLLNHVKASRAEQRARKKVFK